MRKMFLQKGIYIDDDNSSSDISPLDLTGGTPDDDNRKQKKLELATLVKI